MSVMSRTHRSTRFNQELEAGLQWRWHRGWRLSQDLTLGSIMTKLKGIYEIMETRPNLRKRFLGPAYNLLHVVLDLPSKQYG